MTVGQKIKKIRKEAGLTQGELAEKCGLATFASGTKSRAITDYERGVRNPSFEILQKIAVACGYKGFDVEFIK